MVSTHYATVNMLRTIGEVLGTEKLGVHDAGVPPMTDAFDSTQTCTAQTGGGPSCWTYSAFPAEILFTTTSPILNKASVNKANLPHPTHDAAWWQEKTKGLEVSQEDRVDPESFNRIIWEGLMGDKPYPTTRSGADLRYGGTAQPETKRVDVKGGTN